MSKSVVDETPANSKGKIFPETQGLDRIFENI
jgi:hypothetical protein